MHFQMVPSIKWQTGTLYPVQYHNIWFRYYLRTWSATLSLTRSQVQLVAICVNPNYVKVVFHQRVKLGDTSRDSAQNKFLTSPHQTTCPIRSFKTHMITEPVSYTHSKKPVENPPKTHLDEKPINHFRLGLPRV